MYLTQNILFINRKSCSVSVHDVNDSVCEIIYFSSLQICGCLGLLIVPLLFSGTLNLSEIYLINLKIYPGDCLPYLFKLTFWVNYNSAVCFLLKISCSYHF